MAGVTERDPNTGTVDFYMPEGGERVLQPGADPAQAALDWIEAHKTELGVPDARAAFKPVSSTTDDDGMTHVRLQLMAGGVAVWGIETTVSFDDGGAVALFDGPYIPNLEAIASTPPVVSDLDARTKGEADAKSQFATPVSATVLETELVVYVDDEYTHARLARHVTSEVILEDGPVIAHSFVDALDGTILESFVDQGEERDQKQATAKGFDGKDHQVPVFLENSTYWMGRIETAKRGELLPGRWKKKEWNWFSSTTLEGPWDRQAVSAMLNVDRAERFYEEIKWNGTDNKTVWLSLRDPGFDGWNASAGWGKDGTGTIAFSPSVDGQRSAVIALDVVGHEFTHLVTFKVSGLVYRRQPGAINEAMSDIFGEFIERKILGVTDASLVIASATGETIRNMRHPTREEGRLGLRPDNYRQLRTLRAGEKLSSEKNDVGYVHYNSSIVNNAFALMLEGGFNDTSHYGVDKGIGWDQSIKLWWKTQRTILTKRTTIKRLARAQIAMTKKSKHAILPDAVACAWAATDAVGPKWVFDKFAITCPTDLQCKGRPDGWHCDIEPDTIVHCGGGNIDTRTKCPTAQCRILGNGAGAECSSPDGGT